MLKFARRVRFVIVEPMRMCMYYLCGLAEETKREADKVRQCATVDLYSWSLVSLFIIIV